VYEWYDNHKVMTGDKIGEFYVENEVGEGPLKRNSKKFVILLSLEGHTTMP